MSEGLCSPCLGLVPSSGDASVVDTSPVSFTSCWMVPSWLQGQTALMRAECPTTLRALILSALHKIVEELIYPGLGRILEG